jgi:hypothetical protein
MFNYIRKLVVPIVISLGLSSMRVPAEARVHRAPVHRTGFNSAVAYTYGYDQDFYYLNYPYYSNYGYWNASTLGAPNNSPLPFGYGGIYFGSSTFAFAASDFQLGN